MATMATQPPKAMNKSEAECFADDLGRRFRLDFADVARV
jgi:hypothetical protein